jgi:MinD-like ATPase involved in chromosome partitioning or flagellar assembly
MKNTKTTLAGLGAILIAVGGALRAAFDADPSTNLDIASTIAAVTAGIGLILAKDASEKAPVVPPV